MGTATGTRDTLSSGELTIAREMLEQQRRFRREQLAALAGPDVAGPLTTTVGEINAALADGARAALRDVEAALRRISTGSYGRCVGCDVPVGRERLEILPQVAHCLRCQRLASP